MVAGSSKSSHLKLQAGGRAHTRDLISPLTPQVHTSQSFPNNFINRGPDIQTYEPRGAILLQTTTNDKTPAGTLVSIIIQNLLFPNFQFSNWHMF